MWVNVKKVILILAGLSCVALGLLAYNFFSQPDRPAANNTQMTSTIINKGNYRQFTPAKPIDPFVLQQAGSEFNNQHLIGKWTFVIFGYTYCPDVCPTTLTRVKSVLPTLQKLGDIQIAFVSADPLRDTPERLSQYVSYFDNSFLGLTTTHDKLFPFAQSLYLPYGIVTVQKEDNYAVSHSASIALINPKGEYLAQFKPQYIDGEVPTVDMKKMAKSFETIISKYKS